MFEVTATINNGFYNPEILEVRVWARQSGKPPVHAFSYYHRDAFKSDFNYVMEEIANTIQEYIGNNPDEKV